MESVFLSQSKMKQPAASDTSSELLAFSKSFKKTRKASNMICRSKFDCSRKQRKYHKCRRSASLPNSKDLYAVVRDNVLPQNIKQYSSLQLSKLNSSMRKHCERYSSLDELSAWYFQMRNINEESCIDCLREYKHNLTLPTSCVSCNIYHAIDHLGSQLKLNDVVRSSGSKEKETKAATNLNSNFTPSNERPTLLETNTAENSSSAFYRIIDAMPNMNILRTKKSIPLVSFEGKQLEKQFYRRVLAMNDKVLRMGLVSELVGSRKEKIY
ncbi:unnamed protein product [Thelazia callipaeda]|uniref:RGS domain-containing protein n=1 Tax=Thelazia callipaeda TaxID=103827 RepID=A0A0N5CJ18_THECL|nr:unnamed protein product [Thelazia callipaeda]